MAMILELVQCPAPSNQGQELSTPVRSDSPIVTLFDIGTTWQILVYGSVIDSSEMSALFSPPPFFFQHCTLGLEQEDFEEASPTSLFLR